METQAGFDAKAFLKTLTALPGVYRMLGDAGEVLYVGKARNLKKRVASYFRAHPASAKVRRLVAQIRDIEVTVTHTEGEALLLESNLIKRHQPRYNVLLRDDKGYPFLHLSAGAFPRLTLHRGARRWPGRYFGPYPNTLAVRDTLTLLQKVFRLRQCEDSFFNNRSRPCLQYQIRRCSGPCTGLIDQEQYRRDVDNAVLLLEGRSSEVIDALVQRMEAASAQLRFEEAAACRDRIIQLRQVQERQYVDTPGGDLDVVACAVQGGAACVQVFFFRDGRNLGNKPFFPQIPEGAEAGEILSAFMAQYYLDKEVPGEILVSHPLEEAELLAQALRERSGHRVAIAAHVRGDRARWVGMALANAGHALAARLSSQAGMRQRFEALQEALDLEQEVARIECFDVSHTQGEATVASCVVFTVEGPAKSQYRRYNINDVAPGDDYGALRQALARRYTRLREGEGLLPDVLFIDGGKGQVAQARAVLEELQVIGVAIVGVAKGPERRPGMETLHLAGEERPRMLAADAIALHLIQQLRDEAHRFAITGHRQRRAKARKTSVLESIPGVGPKRRQLLLKQFGGLQQLSRAGVEDLVRVAGISRELAQRIYDALHLDG
ncbi:MAG: excinuclease ABC subunit UvrC [Pseudomonadota bacterium]|nr:excinuclease ABC subunit UvrC [Pseudomonadota bacterium]